jgi:hypothetical protein
MAWPPTLPPTGRANDTAQQDAHPSDHNTIATALGDIVDRIDGIQSGKIFANSDGNGQVSATFPRPFTGEPIVVGTRQSTAGNQLVAHIHSLSSTSVTFVVTSNNTLQTNTSNITVQWIAVGELA